MDAKRTVIVERSFDQPSVFEELQAAEDAVAWCLQQHRVRFVRSYLSLDGRSMVCVYEAPDADSVRETQRIGKLPFSRVWGANVVEPTGRYAAQPGMSTVIVERALPRSYGPDDVRTGFAGAAGCFSINRAGLLESNLSLDGMRMVCVFEAPDAEAVRRANLQLGFPFARAWTASVHPGRKDRG